MQIILVCDHGQLPPVRDKRMFDVSGVRRARDGKPLVTAPKHELAGVTAYDSFEDV